MNRKNTYFLTGGTGLLGSYLLKLFLEQGHTVYALARSKKDKDATSRIKTILTFWNTKKYKTGQLRIVEGDITKKNFGIARELLEDIHNNVSEIFHCAASIQFNVSLEGMRNINVVGTANAMEFALLCANIKKVNHISTAYVCGNHSGIFREDELDLGQTFSTAYQQSKFETEKVVGKYREKGLWIDIFRPPFIVGESTSGKTTNFHAFYQLLFLWADNIFDHFPGKNCYLNIIPIDILASAILEIASNTKTRNEVYHPFASDAISLDHIFNLASSHISFKTKLVSFSEFNFDTLTPTQKIIIKNNILYFNENIKLDSKKTEKKLYDFGFVFPKISNAILLKLLRYAFDRYSINNI